jgi:hypothetical protein
MNKDRFLVKAWADSASGVMMTRERKGASLEVSMAAPGAVSPDTAAA